MLILMVAILLSGYEAASHVINQLADEKTQSAFLLPCPDYHSDNELDNSAPIKNLEVSCHHCGVYPVGTTTLLQKTIYARKAVFATMNHAFLVNGLAFPLFRPPQSLA